MQIRLAVILAVAGLAIGTAAAAVPAQAAPARQMDPQIKLIAAQNSIDVQGQLKNKTGKQVIVSVDPGIWLASLGSALQLDVARGSYIKPVTLTQIISRPDRPPLRRPLPASLLDGWNGLKNMVSLTVKDSAGKVAGSARLTVCPGSPAPERESPDSPATSPYPLQCGAFDPFPLSAVWGIAKGWAVDPAAGGPSMTLHLGSTYQVTEAIAPRFASLLGIPARDATATVIATVTASTPASRQGAANRSRPRASALAPHPAVPTLKNPPESVLPDLVPLPAWRISVAHVLGHDLLQFAATVWVGGNGPLDVEGFRSGGSPIMPAYQYFYKNGKVIGRVRAGTMGFDSAHGHDHWHFQQFAEYQLLDANKKLVLRSQKVGFCIAPSDAVDMLLPRAQWQPASTGLAGQCGSPTALWVREMVPLGWGDTYLQFLAGQAFDITRLPNGTYYVEVAANPEHVLHETSTANDVSLRKVILTGTKGHRHVKVPAWHGIDPEG
jgi:hypothetical protein